MCRYATPYPWCSNAWKTNRQHARDTWLYEKEGERGRVREGESRRMKSEERPQGDSSWKIKLCNSSEQLLEDHRSRDNLPPVTQLGCQLHVYESVCTFASSCLSFFHGYFSLILAVGDGCNKASEGSHHHALHGFKAAFGSLYTSELAVFAWPAALSVEWVHLVRTRDTGRRCSRG